MNEKQKNDILAAELDTDQLEKISGGGSDVEDIRYEGLHTIPSSTYGCTENEYRTKDQGCAATVEAGSHCWSNDACSLIEVKYTD